MPCLPFRRAAPSLVRGLAVIQPACIEKSALKFSRSGVSQARKFFRINGLGDNGSSGTALCSETRLARFGRQAPADYELLAPFAAEVMGAPDALAALRRTSGEGTVNSRLESLSNPRLSS